jgi:rhodanese-related sulfurtransferase/DNA-directed RNA polymerase subunit RPC12/RpoP
MKNFPGMLALLVVVTVGFSFTNRQSIGRYELRSSHRDTQYVCLPCGRTCDHGIYTKAGTCPSCMMKLVDKASVKFNSIEPGAICVFIKDMGEKNVVLLDVRSAEEFNGKDKDKFGKLKAAINIPVEQLEKRAAELNKYKNKEIIVYCSHSHRSPMASYILTQKGFTRVTNMLYGMSEWKNKVSSKSCSNDLYVRQ